MAAAVSNAHHSLPQARPSSAGRSHADILKVVRSDQPFKSAAISLVSLSPGTILAKITEATLVPRATWTSFQTGRDEHMEFNSDIVFINHSYDPNLVVDTTRMEVRVADDRHIAKGDELT
ncbi:galactose-proton symport [Fusarium mexicanum]|uniref:Galactose-proton symport n=1 Tax=Fusarium mexicanum TaxID=751941 RepID=A0A8H5JPM0_9HYPO|nr:galactose-proton symport [Fusarium mexicanum]